MYKLGKLPARKDAVSFTLKQYLDVSQLPTPPLVLKRDFSPDAWDMLGNDRYGDCVWAGAAHETMLWNAEAKRAVRFDDRHVLADYGAVTGFTPSDPSTDQGTDMQVAASYRRKTGVADASGKRHKVDAYLAITPGIKTQLKRAIYLFGTVGVGIEFPASAMDQFNAGKAWVPKGSSPIKGGHYVPAIGYDARYVHLVTWGRLQKASWGFISEYMDEGLVYISPEMLTGGKSPEGFDAAQLRADLAQLT